MRKTDGGKATGALLSIGELAEKIGVQTHVLRYWETRFPQLKPLQRSGRRRYYRTEDVDLVTQIHDLLHVQGYTVDGARNALAARSGRKGAAAPKASPAEGMAAPEVKADTPSGPAPAVGAGLKVSPVPAVAVDKLAGLRNRLEAALG
ncbi:MAG TPA: MerR family transcriptional regulator [Sphingopyxis sp.]|nr:MerR family transcriptional regulator [Sphingopyxis sp.]